MCFLHIPYLSQPSPSSLVWHSHKGNCCTDYPAIRETQPSRRYRPRQPPAPSPRARRWQEFPHLHNLADTEAKFKPRPTSSACHAAISYHQPLLFFLLTLSHRFSAMVVSIQVLPILLQQPLQFSIDSNKDFLPFLFLLNSSMLRVSQRKQRTCRDNLSARDQPSSSSHLSPCLFADAAAFRHVVTPVRVALKHLTPQASY